MLLDQFLPGFAFHRHESNLLAHAQFADGRVAQTGSNESGVDPPVLDLVNGFAIVEVINLDILVGHAMRLENHPGVEFHAGVGRTHADAFALEFGKTLDAGILGGDDLADIRPETHQGAEIIRRLLPFIRTGTLHRLNDGVGHGDGNFTLVGTQRVDVFGRGAGRRGRRLVAQLADQIGEGTTDRKVNPAGRPGQHGDVMVAALDVLRLPHRGHGRQSEGKRYGDGAQKTLAAFHRVYSLLSSMKCLNRSDPD